MTEEYGVTLDDWCAISDDVEDLALDLIGRVSAAVGQSGSRGTQMVIDEMLAMDAATAGPVCGYIFSRMQEDKTVPADFAQHLRDLMLACFPRDAIQLH